MSVPFEPVAPPPKVPPLDNPPDPYRIPGEEPLPDPEPDDGGAPISRSPTRYSTCGMLCTGVRLQPEDRK